MRLALILLVSIAGCTDEPTCTSNAPCDRDAGARCIAFTVEDAGVFGAPTVNLDGRREGQCCVPLLDEQRRTVGCE